MEADVLSKTLDTDDWSITFELFYKIQVLTKLNFTLDPFANTENSKCLKFYSNFMCPGSAGINCLNFPWTGEICWVCPPPNLACKALAHMKMSQTRGVLVLPGWVSHPVWLLINVHMYSAFCIRKWSFPGYKFLKSGSTNGSIFGDKFKGEIWIFYFNFA